MMLDALDYGGAVFCPHCYTIELEASDGPIWATDQCERWAWVCAGCGYTYTYDEVFPIDDADYELAAWDTHVRNEWELHPEWDMHRICQELDEQYPFETFFSGRVKEVTFDDGDDHLLTCSVCQDRYTTSPSGICDHCKHQAWIDKNA